MSLDTMGVTYVSVLFNLDGLNDFNLGLFCANVLPTYQKQLFWFVQRKFKYHRFKSLLETVNNNRR